MLVAGAAWAWVEFLILVWCLACGFEGATRRGTYLIVSDRGRFGGLRSGGTRLGCAGQFRLPSGVPLMGDRRGMGEGNSAGCGPRGGRWVKHEGAKTRSDGATIFYHGENEGNEVTRTLTTDNTEYTCGGRCARREVPMLGSPERRWAYGTSGFRHPCRDGWDDFLPQGTQRSRQRSAISYQRSVPAWLLPHRGFRHPCLNGGG